LQLEGALLKFWEVKWRVLVAMVVVAHGLEVVSV
jgi:hypothetical protein